MVRSGKYMKLLPRRLIQMPIYQRKRRNTELWFIFDYKHCIDVHKQPSTISIILELGQIAVFKYCFSLGSRRKCKSWSSNCLRGALAIFALLFSVSDGHEGFFPLEIGDESHSSFGFGDVEVLFELIVLILQEHSDLICLLLLEVGLLLGAIRGWVTVFSTNGTLYVESVFGLEGAGPGTMPFLLTVFTVIFINTLNLLIIAI